MDPAVHFPDFIHCPYHTRDWYIYLHLVNIGKYIQISNIHGCYGLSRFRGSMSDTLKNSSSFRGAGTLPRKALQKPWWTHRRLASRRGIDGSRESTPWL